MKFYRVLLSVLILVCFQSIGFAQLRKTSKTEKIITINLAEHLCKTEVDDIEIYSLTLPNASKYYEPVVLYLGTYQEMISNLQDLTTAMEAGEKGEIFDFQSCGFQYTLVFHRVLGQRCFKVYREHSVSSDYGNLYRYTTDRILEYFGEKQLNEKN